MLVYVHPLLCLFPCHPQEPGGYCGGELDAWGLEQRASSRRSSHALELQDAAAAAAAAEAGLAGAAAAVLADDGKEAEAEADAAVAVNGGSTQLGALLSNKAGTAAVDIEAGGGDGGAKQRGSWLQRAASSKRHMLADRAATGLDRTATGLAAAAPGASRWGASYWTQVGGVGSCKHLQAQQ